MTKGKLHKLRVIDLTFLDQYVCQRAANAIIAEIGPYQISSDALQSINQFLDQMLMLLLRRTQSLDLSQIKTNFLSLVPLSLGKNAIVEAELEVKTYSETSVIDYPLYERMRSWDAMSFPLEQVWMSLRHECIDHCTLADKAKDTEDTQDDDDRNRITLSPMVIVYITTVLEHMAEYVLTTVAVTADQEDTEYIRIKEVYLALLDDVQVGSLFQQTDIQSRLEKRVISYQQQYQRMTLPSPVPSPEASYKNQASSSQDTFDYQVNENRDHSYNYNDQHNDERLDSVTAEGIVGADDDDDDDDDAHSDPPPSAHTQTSSVKSTKSSSYYRPISIMSNSTTTTTRSTSSSKKGFRFFGKKDKRSSVASQSATGTVTQTNHSSRHISSSSPTSLQMYDPDAPALDFEDLIRSGNTMKVSLTPNRLRSIEVKTAPTPLSTSSASVYDHHYQNQQQSHHSNISSPTSYHQHHSKMSSSSLSPSSPPPPSGVPFENPRAAPKPPPTLPYQPSPSPSPTPPTRATKLTTKQQQTPPLTPNSSIASRLSKVRSPPPFEGNQHRQQLAQKTKQPPPAPLQLVNHKQSSHDQHDFGSDAEIDDVCVMDLPSPPNTTDRHPSSSNLSTLSEQQSISISSSSPADTANMVMAPVVGKSSIPSSVVPRPRYNRPSSMVAKRASGSIRPTSYHESFALTMEQQQQAIGHSDYTRPLSSASSISDDLPSVTFSIPTSPLRASSGTPPPPSSLSMSTSAPILDSAEMVSAIPRTIIRRRTPRPLSQMILEEEKESVNPTIRNTGIISNKDETKQQPTATNRPSSVPSSFSSSPLASSTAAEAKESEAKMATVSSQDDDTPFAAASNTSYDRRDRILQLLQQQLKKTPVMIDSYMQTDPIPGLPSLASVLSSAKLSSASPAVPTLIVNGEKLHATRSDDQLTDGLVSSSSEQGLVEGDEEWFLQDDDWEDTQEQDSMMAEWLLGET